MIHGKMAFTAALMLGVSRIAASGAAYDPLALPQAEKPPQTLDLTVHDEKRQRDVPVRVYLPVETTPQPVILFSPGLGGSRLNYVYLGTHWAGRGFVEVCLQHPGSDDAVWRDKPPAEGFRAMRQAVGLANFLLRNQDVSAVLDQLERWNHETGNPLAGRLDLDHIGMAGHSFGAVTTQAVSGERFIIAGTSFTDARIKAALMMSPSNREDADSQQTFGSVSIPWMLMTGTNDHSPIGKGTAESRLAVFEGLPPGGKYELVLDGAEHSAFSDRALPGDRLERNPQHHQAILALSTAFWDAKLRGDEQARAFLDGGAARSVLAKNDRWREK